MEQFLSVNQVAELLGVSVNSVKGYRAKGLLPEPDAKVGNAFGWRQKTIEAWNERRPGSGARTDLRRS